jgi:HEAT repeat protein
VPVEDRIGTEFSHFPIVKGLERLLRGYNYVFIHNPEKSTGNEHEIRKIIITSREGGSLHRRMEPAIAYTEKPPIEYPGEEQYDEDIMISEAEYAPRSIESEIALDPLRDALQDEDAGIRLSAVGALGVIGGDMASQALESVLADKEEAVRMFATAELRRLKGEG